MKIHILFEFVDTPKGGGYQFLRALKDIFIKRGQYVDDISKADVVLINNFHIFFEVIDAKMKYPDKCFIHRVDGPAKLCSSPYDIRDDFSYILNDKIADGTVFQSEWSKIKNSEAGFNASNRHTTIMNAPNPDIFYKKQYDAGHSGKWKVVATSWSSNLKKGFDVYKWLDDNLDFNKFEMTFVGNSPYEYKNIRHIEPLVREDLADFLRKNDIFITASQSDPCSNSLIEALHSGLPAIGFNDGGHPFIIGKAGYVFDNKEELPDLFDAVVDNYDVLTSLIDLPQMDAVADKYYDFFYDVYNTGSSKRVTVVTKIYLKFIYYLLKIKQKLQIKFLGNK